MLLWDFIELSGLGNQFRDAGVTKWGTWLTEEQEAAGFESLEAVAYS